VGGRAGQKTGNTALLRSLFGIFRRGDLAVFDRYCAGRYMLAWLRRCADGQPRATGQMKWM
jgi:hypothetical protein